MEKLYSNKNNASQIILLIYGIFFLSSCNITSYLNKDEKLLSQNSITIQSDEISEKESKKIKEELALLLLQQPNKKIALKTYFNNQNNADSSFIKGWFVKNFAEKPSYFDTAIFSKTAISMENYLKKDGYFDAKVIFNTKINGHYGKVNYIAIPNRQYTFKDVTYEVANPSLSRFLSSYWAESFVKPGVKVSNKIYDQEKQRISNILYNNGYYFFDPSIIGPFIGDSLNNKVNAAVRVNNPEDPKISRAYTINRVNIHGDFEQNFFMLYNLDTMINGYRFLQINKTFKIKPSTILPYLYIKPGELYSKAKFDRTFNRLNRLGLYRYINISEKIDENDSSKINVDIKLPPSKTLNFGYDYDLSSASLRTISSGTGSNVSLSTQLGVNLLKRNLFNSGELFRSSLSLGIEIPFSANVNSRQSINFKNELAVPRFMDYLFLVKTLSKMDILKKSVLGETFINSLNDNANTAISLDVEYTFFKDWYKYINVNAAYGFEATPNKEKKVKWNHVGVTFFSPKVFAQYANILNQNIFLKRSFEGTRFFTGFLLRDLNYTFQQSPDKNNQSKGFTIFVELSGFEVNGLNLLIQKNKTWRLFDSDFSRYFKLGGQFRLRKLLSKGVLGATQMSVFYAKPFGVTKEVPYVKQYEIGGPFSIRGWAIRELGPGSYLDTTAQGLTTYYQTGDFKVEFLSEIRFDIYSLLKGAIFLDAGNVWANKSKYEFRENSNFTINQFYQSIAIGSGMGLRLDVGFFVMRLDVGLKIKYPYINMESNSYYNSPK